MFFLFTLVSCGVVQVSYIMARASGRRTARYMVNRYRNTFDTDEAQPPIPVSMRVNFHGCFKFCVAAKQCLEGLYSSQQSVKMFVVQIAATVFVILQENYVCMVSIRCRCA